MNAQQYYVTRNFLTCSIRDEELKYSELTKAAGSKYDFDRSHLVVLCDNIVNLFRQ
jgi:hypothetical protein